ncbi:MAG TPA: hypothetical protein VMR97_00470 [Acidimicrobiales bacterium]|nr:hypothetical protein [Acidimicrobiales bacterium]
MATFFAGARLETLPGAFFVALEAVRPAVTPALAGPARPADFLDPGRGERPFKTSFSMALAWNRTPRLAETATGAPV